MHPSVDSSGKSAPPPSSSSLAGSKQKAFTLLRHMNAWLPQEKAWLFPAPWAWALLGLLMLAAAIGFHLSPMEFVVDAKTRALGLAIAILFCMGMLHARRGSSWLAGLLFAFAFFLMAGALGRCLNYLVTELNLPYQDALLDSFHELVGFDWRAHVAWLNEHPRLVRILDFAYASYAWMIPLTILVLAMIGAFDRLREFLLLFSLAGFASMILGGLVPAMGTYGFYGLSPAGLENIPATGTSYLSDLEAVRAGALREFLVSEATGLTQFPSFHTIMALLFAWAWRCTWLQWPVWGLSTLTIMATPVMGGHYLIDLIGGTAILVLVHWLLTTMEADTYHQARKNAGISAKECASLPKAVE